MRVASYNICHCRYAKDGPQGVAAVIVESGADVVGLQEVDISTNRVSFRNILKEMAQAAGMPYFAFCPTMPKYRLGAYGTAILSRVPFRDFRVCPYEEKGREPRAYSRAEMTVEGRTFTFFNTHCAHKEPAVRKQQLCELAQALQQAGSFVVTGDLNEEDITPYLEGTMHLVNDGRRYPTFHPGFAAIDHIICSADFSVSASGMFCTPASDHDLLWADLQWPD